MISSDLSAIPPLTLENLGSFKDLILKSWDQQEQLSVEDEENLLPVIRFILDQLDKGYLQICEKVDSTWYTHHWLKKAILLSFRLQSSQVFTQGPKIAQNNSAMFNGLEEIELRWFDKIPLKCQAWEEEDFKRAGFRSVPGAIIRHSAYISTQAVIMPSFINVGAFIGPKTMIDTWSTIGSCAYIGANCHISGGVGIGGTLEPFQSTPVIIEDNCFIGARCEIAEGVIVEEGAVLSMGVFIGASTKIINRSTGEISQGRIPAYSVVVPGTLPSPKPNMPSLACAVIVKQVDAQTRSKTSINDLLRL